MISLVSAMTFAILRALMIDTFFCTLCTLCTNVVTFFVYVSITVASLTFMQALVEADQARKQALVEAHQAREIQAAFRCRQAREERQRAREERQPGSQGTSTGCCCSCQGPSRLSRSHRSQETRTGCRCGCQDPSRLS